MPLGIFTEKDFFGRERELDVLKSIASDAGAGNATGIFLSGKWGTGKTEMLKHLYNRLFKDQDEAIPFFYTIKTAFTSVSNFSRDYFSSFILQSLAFIRKDPSLIYTGIYALEDLRRIAGESGALWAVDIIESYLQLREQGDTLREFEFAVSAPFRCFLKTEKPLIVIIDDFHKIRKLERVDEEDQKLWMLFENSLQSRYTPHIISGFEADIHEMFFEETGIGEYLEVLNISGLGKEDARMLFTALCERYRLNIEPGLTGFIDIFNGNPFYIKSFVQAARQAGRAFSWDDYLTVYFKEITKGRIYSYWTSLLKTHVPKFHMRRPSLKLLHHLPESEDLDFSDLTGSLSLSIEDIDNLIKLLHASGTIETGFSLLELADDCVMSDTIRALYLKEVEKESYDNIKEAVTGSKVLPEREDSEPSFDISVPAAPKAELVAAKSLEQILRHYDITDAITGQLQLALVELFTNVLDPDESPDDRYVINFRIKANMFSMVITTSQKNIAISEADGNLLTAYVDDVKVEETLDGSRITLLRKVSGGRVSAT